MVVLCACSHHSSRSLRVVSAITRSPSFGPPRSHVLDVEVDHARKTIFAFDILVYDGRDLRGDRAADLNARLAWLRSALPVLSDGWTVVEKEYHDYRWGMRATLDSVMGPHSDGLIFVPEGEPYPTRCQWKTLLKWKPPSHNSIDFLLDKDRVLCVGDVNGSVVPFRPQLPLDASRVRPPPACRDIVQCVLAPDGRRFEALRVRTDKPRPNFKTVALNIWKSMKQPLDLHRLNISGHQAVWTHHGFLKNQLAQQCASAGPTNVLELALELDGGGAVRDNTRWTRLGCRVVSKDLEEFLNGDAQAEGSSTLTYIRTLCGTRW
ncbi:uncharacterized protein EV422DRAFT_34321 [Fimicolochytrium jonesii]|uniref:uncharacterized protein n=1 Tax=Fimicolochytrium jonesii TaxID=1396493 RepID=UPI0022FE3D5E|nr:uncharacterized protein EV422DRAFT_34321 [Fimicolochytrium jonesii]KAI8827273.1 hypothetical protein EV422DRAFT_34321 [Fimicolochytrium jonesii]